MSLGAWTGCSPSPEPAPGSGWAGIQVQRCSEVRKALARPVAARCPLRPVLCGHLQAEGGYGPWAEERKWRRWRAGCLLLLPPPPGGRRAVCATCGHTCPCVRGPGCREWCPHTLQQAALRQTVMAAGLCPLSLEIGSRRWPRRPEQTQPSSAGGPGQHPGPPVAVWGEPGGRGCLPAQPQPPHLGREGLWPARGLLMEFNMMAPEWVGVLGGPWVGVPGTGSRDSGL